MNPEPDRNTWATPPDLWAAICHRFGYPLLDVCATDENTKCQTWIPPETDGLKSEWLRGGALNFCNPGYSNVEPWLEKAYQESLLGASSLVLTHVTLAAKVKPYFQKATAIYMLLNPRVQFIAPPGVEASSNSKDNMIWVFDPGMPQSTVWWDWTKECGE